MRTTTFAIALLSLGLAGCGDPLFFAEVEEKRVCVTLVGEQIPGVPAGLGPQTAHWEGDVDLGKSIPGLDTGATTGSVQLVSVSVKGSTSLAGITYADVSLTDSAGVTSHVVHYEQPSPLPDPDQITVAITPMELIDRVKNGGNLHYSVTFDGSPPTVDWTADIETCMYAKVMVDALKALQNK